MVDEDTFTYWAFISYSHADRHWGDWLHTKLERYRVPARLVGKESRDGAVPKRIFPVFRDREELPTSADLGDMLIDALRKSRYLIVICSPRAAQSRWVAEEIRTFKSLGRSSRILCLIVDGEPNASDKSESGLDECFPEPVRFEVDEEGALTDARCEPIAADARPHGDGKRDAFLKIVAGVLGVGFDALKQRDLQRKQRRMVAITTASLALCAVLATLSVLAIVARDQAVAARNDAVARADDLRSFAWSIIYDADAATAHIAGTTEVRRLLIDRAITYLDTLEGHHDTPQVKIDRAGGFIYVARVLGDPYAPNLGRTNEALAYIEQAIEILEGMLPEVDEPNDLRWKLAAAYSTHANILGVASGAEAALARYRNAEALFAQITPTTDTSRQYEDDRSRLQSAIGDALLLLGRLDEAETAYHASAAIKLDLLGIVDARELLPLSDGGLPETERTLLRDYARIAGRFAEIEQRRGNRDAAQKLLDDAYAIHDELLRRYPGHAVYRTDFATICWRLGELAETQHDDERAYRFHRRALETRQHFFELEPNDNQALVAYWQSIKHVARLEFRLGRPDVSIAAYDHYRWLGERVREQVPSTEQDVLVEDTDALLRIALIRVHLQQFDEGVRRLQEVIARAEELTTEAPALLQGWRFLAEASLQVGLYESEHFDPPGGHEAFARAIEAGERALAIDADDERARLALAVALNRQAVMDELPLDTTPMSDEDLHALLLRLEAQHARALKLIEPLPEDVLVTGEDNIRTLIEQSLSSVQEQLHALGR